MDVQKRRVFVPGVGPFIRSEVRDEEGEISEVQYEQAPPRGNRGHKTLLMMLIVSVIVVDIILVAF
jgi:hypothetical protein